MKLAQKLVSEQFTKPVSRFMKFACYFVMFFCLLCLVLSFMGRQTFFLHTGTGTYEHAIYAEENHTPASRGFTVTMPDDIHVRTGSSGRIDLTAHIGLSLMFAVDLIPMVFAYWFLSRLFANIEKGRIFTEQNASCLLYYGLLRLLTALLSPVLKLLVCGLANCVSDSQISLATGQNMLQTFIPSLAFLIAAYIIHYGVHLQDEADHTL